MLPFLKKQEVGTSGPVVQNRKPDEETPLNGMEMAAQDLIEAVKPGDAKAVASALKAAYEICESEPEAEGPEDLT